MSTDHKDDGLEPPDHTGTGGSGRDDGDPPPPGDYDVGYGRPPREHRFKPGQSGNRKGRPRKSRNFRTMLKEVLETMVPVRQNGKRRKVTLGNATLLSLGQEAMKPDLKAMTTLLSLAERYGVLDDQPDREQPLTPEEQAILDDFLKRLEDPKK